MTKSLHYNVAKAKTKAVFQGAGLTPRFQITVTTSDGQTVEIEMDATTAHQLIEESVTTYRVINPPIRRRL